MTKGFHTSRAGVSVLALSLAGLFPAAASAQDVPPAAVNDPQPQDATPVAGAAEGDEIVVTGFRESISAALTDKRLASGVVDVIKADDIAKFPDNNLAESIQRVPGVAIARDGGEGRSISVRGLGPTFTRVRINGMEAIATTGSSDAGGGVNRGRGFDFNVFASELFNSITVRKTASADIEEGSLGATVDLQTARPFDYKDNFVVAASAQAGWNDLARKVTPRVAGLLSWHNDGETVGALLSAAYSERKVREEGHSTVRWNPTGVNGGFNAASTLPGYTLAQINRTPANNGSNWDDLIYHPRIPRYDTWQYDLKRLGVTGSLQFRPSETTLLTFDGLYSNSKTTRTENYLEAISFSRTGATGKPQTIIRDGEVNDQNELVYGVFDDVDMRVESRMDKLETEFQQYTGTLTQEFSDRLRGTLYGGYAKSDFKNPIQTTITLDRLNSDGFSWDYRDNDREPVMNWGFDVASAASWSMINGSSDIRIRPQAASNKYRTGKAMLDWDVVPDSLTFKGGLEWRKFSYSGSEQRRLVAETQVPTLTATQVASLTTVLDGVTGDPSRGGGYIIPNFGAFVDTLGIYCNCVQNINGTNVDFRLGGVENTNARSSFVDVEETEKAAFFQANFTIPLGSGMTLRGDAGMRYVTTHQNSGGYAAVNGGIERLEVERDYDYWLPSFNLVGEITPEFLLRFGVAKVITRPGLGTLSPGGSFTAQASNRGYSTGNPYLDPTEATNIDASAEWYFSKGSLISLGYFEKRISTLSGTSVTVQVPFTELGLPADLLTGTGVAPTDIFNYTRTVNGQGGTLRGFEVNYQHQLTFLPGFLANMGLLANYTQVKAELSYPGYGGGNAPPIVGPLTNLSEKSANGTLFYEDKVFSLRGSVTYRSGYLTAFAGGAREQSTEEGVNETLNFDASASLKLTENISLSVEAINLTDEPQDFYIDQDNQVVLYHRTGRQFYGGVRFRF
ncbi:TonB-dependent receptor [Sphingomonas sp. S2-65]|uniref:TonB-dependent receptor n=1 Tax=Sphingomonas sp. S2-65 TaxID=2903960 RepID=UPI001F27A693|nr:TonB-dependent receptor [Sphingomonas sp. S2-65]UYY60031.1 TonB-dependent receptor [Sphingomonas sp. S2-65]